jgi:hypothetical protein
VIFPPLEAIQKAVDAAMIATNFRPEDIREVGALLARLYPVGMYREPGFFYEVIVRDLSARGAKQYRVELESGDRRVELRRDGRTNVIKVYLEYPVRAGMFSAYVLDQRSVKREVGEARAAHVHRLTKKPIANDNHHPDWRPGNRWDRGDNSLSPSLRTRMVMKGRLATLAALNASLVAGGAS